MISIGRQTTVISTFFDLPGIIGGLKVPFPLKKCSDACNGCGMVCPLVESKQYNFTVALTVQKGYPAVSNLGTLRKYDGNHNGNVQYDNTNLALITSMLTFLKQRFHSFNKGIV